MESPRTRPDGSAEDVPARCPLNVARTAPRQPGRASALLLEHGSLELRYYAPRGTDPQTPHTRDELYVVTSGRGWFVRGGERVPFEPGDALFVAAGVEHRFEDFGDDFRTWVVFIRSRGRRAADRVDAAAARRRSVRLRPARAIGAAPAAARPGSGRRA